MKMSRANKRRLKLNRKRILMFSLISTLLLGSGVAYIIAQYNSGTSLVERISTGDNRVGFDAFEETKPELGVVNVLLLGSDSRGEGSARADTLMIAQYNQNTNEVKLASIMRDTFVEIPGYGLNKINAAFSLGGQELVRKTVKHNFDIDVNYYSIVNFTGFPELIDVIAPNGIQVDIKSTMSHGIDMSLNPGVQALHGDELLGYVRYRNDSEGDFGRVKRQQEVLSKLKGEMVSFKSIANIPKTLGVISELVETNMDNKTMLTIGKDLISNKSESMETMSIPIKGSFEDKRVKGSGLVLSIDLEENKQALNDFLHEGESSE